MSVRSFRTSSIRTGEKRSKFWDQSAVVLNPAFDSIASANGTGAGTVTFSNIPQTYQHLQLRLLIRSDNAFSSVSVPVMRFNNSSTSSTYRTHRLYGDGVSAIAEAPAQAQSQFNDLLAGTSAEAAANIMGVAIIDIHDYANTSKNTTVRVFTGHSLNSTETTWERVQLASGVWLNTSAVTEINLIMDQAAGWGSQSRLSLYGIKAAA